MNAICDNCGKAFTVSLASGPTETLMAVNGATRYRANAYGSRYEYNGRWYCSESCCRSANAPSDAQIAAEDEAGRRAARNPIIFLIQFLFAGAIVMV